MPTAFPPFSSQFSGSPLDFSCQLAGFSFPPLSASQVFLAPRINADWRSSCLSALSLALPATILPSSFYLHTFESRLRELSPTAALLRMTTIPVAHQARRGDWSLCLGTPGRNEDLCRWSGREVGFQSPATISLPSLKAAVVGPYLAACSPASDLLQTPLECGRLLP
jgi:hypothetical protein